ncbi:MAG: hypothetical protein KVP17_002465 [Porospora cf. gigantea B]|uniref:uncharacterized protein n=1 Tax=Porospora cf. gigantea B TaxID=2853592 RepID=UPI003571C46D|nr:MAG: hypothetical protein KVP17_002465 [Porospora cf. gigantea B]
MRASLAFLCTLSASLRVGIIGGGVGGTSTAYFLRQNDADVHIDVYERKDTVGGRAALVNMGGNEYEAGAAIIHSENLYASRLLKVAGSETMTSAEPFGLLGKDGLAFQSSSLGWMTSARLLWRYGLDLIRLDRLVRSTLRSFSRVYPLLDSGESFSSVHELLETMDPEFVALTTMSLESYLQSQGFSERIRSELVHAATIVNYGQTPSETHAFVGLVGLAGAIGSLFSVRHGNFQLAEGALRASGANLISAEVTRVTRSQPNIVEYMIDGELLQKNYDAVVIATPMTADSNTRPAVEDANDSYDGRYFNLGIAFVEGDPNYPDLHALLSTRSHAQFNSISRVASVKDQTFHSVYKIFFNEDIDPLSFFSAVKTSRVGRWRAYPDYSTTPSGPWHMVLGSGLYYLNAIEWAASAIEMSLIAGKNVANAICKVSPDESLYDEL